MAAWSVIDQALCKNCTHISLPQGSAVNIYTLRQGNHERG